jgi:chemotaxis response regulator CheB
MLFASSPVVIPENGSGLKGPVFILADDDRAAADSISGKLFPECYFIIQVTNPRHVRNYAKRLNPQAIFLAEPIEYPKGGAEALLNRLLEEVGTPVIILSELWTSESAERWRRLGAQDCIPHPTRSGLRLEVLRAKIQDLFFASDSPNKS